METTVNQDPVNQALQYAGKPTEVTPELIALDKDRVTSESNVSEEQYIYKFKGVPCFPRCDLSTLTGAAKVGKTNVAAMLMACAVERQVLEFERVSEEPIKVMWFDTEQSLSTTKHILTDRVGKLIGQQQFPDENFFVYNVRHHTPDERVEMLALAIDTYKPDICFVDGIADLMKDINSGPESVELMQRLLAIASVNKCNITMMIHLNRSGERLNLRGWIGTVMLQKSYEVFSCDKRNNSRTFSVDLSFSRRYYVESPMYYEFNKAGLPCVVDAPTESNSSKNGKSASERKEDKTTFNQEFVDENASDKSMPWNLRKLFDTAMDGAAFLSCDDLRERVMKLSGIRIAQYYDKVYDAAEKQRVVKKVLDNKGRVAVIRMPC